MKYTSFLFVYFGDDKVQKILLAVCKNIDIVLPTLRELLAG
jgi:hypothetical protein